MFRFVKYVFIAATVSCCTAKMLSQDYADQVFMGDDVSMSQPQAMGDGMNIDMSYATGTADISLPLMSLPGGTVDINLGLRYITSGIKTTDFSNGIGLGWNLTGLGYIVRQVNGFPDEREWNSYGFRTEFKPYNGQSDLNYYKSILEKKIDADFDIYTYSIPGYSGCFYTTP